MEIDNKKLERTSKLVYYSISGILCLFLILLSNRIIDDLDTATVAPQIESFENKEVMGGLEKKANVSTAQIENLTIKKETIEKTIQTAKENYTNEKQSFDNWVQTRKTLGSPDKDIEVTNRAKKLDKMYGVEQQWRAELSDKQNQIEQEEKKLYETQRSIEKEEEIAQKKYYEELKKYDLKVFLIRLLFVAPVLGLGIFFFVRYRRHKYWPLYFGFTLFSFYAFFFGLVPYLPNYGGYVRYAVGIILSAGLGFYAIKRIRLFIETRQAELKISTQERAKKIKLEVAEKALKNHYCPSCGNDFIVKKWEINPSKNNKNDVYQLVTDFCRHCGLELFKKCTACGNKNFAHLPFCSSCGTNTTEIR
jgi:predicted RNA-binding Zn-ribbon protein involved in translation (DUF1610 family)